ncbi:MAG: exodeoxyribonuclease VII large subunit [Myxococcales bacterium]|nr:exodeoxyribonuclease VII large subunit [Myxococcales bacterium]
MSTLWLFDAELRPTPSEPTESPLRIFTVGELNRVVRSALETHWNDIHVRGELSDVKRHRSGHVYFTLNDEDAVAQLRCVMFRTDAALSKAELIDGARVSLSGGLTLYEARGAYQMVVRVAVPEGAGELKVQFDRLRRKLEAEGLIDPNRRRALPRVPQTVGIVSSMDGAAVVDVLRVASARYPVRLVLAPCTVQGKPAPQSIINALANIQRLPELDVIIITRGGGSAEDLAAFNDESLARAIANSRVPVVSAIGHEVDVTISDLVADLRAATPSNAAELVVPDKLGLTSELVSETRGLQRAMDALLNRARLRLERLAKSVEDPRRHLMGVKVGLHNTLTQLAKCVRDMLEQKRRTLSGLLRALLAHDVRHQLTNDRASFGALVSRLSVSMASVLTQHRNTLARRDAELGALSPIAILARGYALAIDTKTGKALLSSTEVAVGEMVALRLHQGSLVTRVEKKR